MTNTNIKTLGTIIQKEAIIRVTIKGVKKFVCKPLRQDEKGTLFILWNNKKVIVEQMEVTAIRKLKPVTRTVLVATKVEKRPTITKKAPKQRKTASKGKTTKQATNKPKQAKKAVKKDNSDKPNFKTGIREGEKPSIDYKNMFPVTEETDTTYDMNVLLSAIETTKTALTTNRNGKKPIVETSEMDKIMGAVFCHSKHSIKALVTFLKGAMSSYIERLAKRELKNTPAIADYYSYEDIANELYLLAMSGKMTIKAGLNLFTTIYYAMKNILRTERNRMAVKFKASYKAESNNEGSIHVVVTGDTKLLEGENIGDVKTFQQKQYKNTKAVRTMQSKAVYGINEDSIINKIDTMNILTEEEQQILSWLKNGKTKKWIDEKTGKRNDRTFKRIQRKMAQYMAI